MPQGVTNLSDEPVVGVHSGDVTRSYSTGSCLQEPVFRDHAAPRRHITNGLDLGLI